MTGPRLYLSSSIVLFLFIYIYAHKYASRLYIVDAYGYAFRSYIVDAYEYASRSYIVDAYEYASHSYLVLWGIKRIICASQTHITYVFVTHCGDGQTSNGRTTLEENLSFCVERGVHHHGNCRSGLVNSIPFVKKRTHSSPPPRRKINKRKCQRSQCLANCGFLYAQPTAKLELPAAAPNINNELSSD